MGEFDEEYSESDEEQYFGNLREKLEEVLDDKKVGLREAEKKFLLGFIAHVEYDGKMRQETDGECWEVELECPLVNHRNLTDLLEEAKAATALTPELKKYHASLLVQVQLLQTVEYPLRPFEKVFKETRELLALQSVDGVRADRVELYREIVLGTLDIDQYCNKYRAVKMSLGRCLIEGEFEAARALCGVLADDIRDYLREKMNIHFETDENLRKDLLQTKKDAIEAVLEFAADEPVPERQLPYFNRARDIVKLDLVKDFDTISRKYPRKNAQDYSWVEEIIADIQNGVKKA